MIDVQVTLSEQQMQYRERMIADLKHHPLIQQFLSENELSEEFVECYASRLQAHLERLATCNACKGMQMCPYVQKGIYRDIKVVNKKAVDYNYECSYSQQNRKKYAHMKQYKFYSLPKELYDADLYHLDMKNETVIFQKLTLKLMDWLENNPKKGIFFYGGFGVGKTYLSACLSNEFAKQGKEIAFLNTAEFCNDLREKVRNYSEKLPIITQLQYIDVLVLDDIGAEAVTDWIRDSVLYPILNHRMSHNKLTLFTSNLTYENLLQHYTYNNQNESNPMNAARLMERIRCLSQFVQVDGKNRRF